MILNSCSYCQKQLIRNLNFSEILMITKKIPQICEDCSSLFQSLKQQDGCRTCQQLIPTTKTSCDDCLEWKKRYPTYDFCHQAFFVYDMAFKEWLKRYKFMGDIRLAGTFAKQWQKLHRMFTEYLICPIPLTEERLSERGFNQVSEMLRVSHVPYQYLLKRTKYDVPQAQKNKRGTFS